MKLLKFIDHIAGTPDYSFHCPGCKISHGIWTVDRNMNHAIWEFNGDIDKPTFTPSIRVIHHNDGKDIVCHSFVKDGFIEFLSDCTHELAGQTIELENQ